MAVITGAGTQEFHLVQLAPGLLGMKQAVGVGLGDGIVHQGQTGVTADEALLGLAAENIGKHPLGCRQTGQLAVVACLNSIGYTPGGVIEYREDITDTLTN